MKLYFIKIPFSFVQETATKENKESIIKAYTERGYKQVTRAEYVKVRDEYRGEKK